MNRGVVSASSSSLLTRNDRFSLVVVISIIAVQLAAGWLLTRQTQAQTWTYISREAGIEAQYPANWLANEQGDYVVRLRDPLTRPFKTQFVVSIIPAGGQTSIRNALDGLTIQRAASLSAYRVLNVSEVAVNGQSYTQLDFSFVDTDPNPFIQRLPAVVLGRDMVIRDEDRIIILTYMAEQTVFDERFDDFQRFITSMTY
jgi:hypothetical protein